jgi:hypothetical protein
MSTLKDRAKKQHISVNLLILKLVEEGIGYRRKTKKTYHDLDYLAGTWTAQQAEDFTKATEHFEKIDKELWE